MAQRIQLKAVSRTQLGKSKVRQARAAGRIPGVLYGHGEPQPLELAAVEFISAIQKASSENVLVDLEIGGSKHLALIQEVQHHPLRDKVLHVDFHEIDPNQKIHAEVPVHELGEAAGVKNGGILDHSLRTIKVECLPQHLPESFTVDISQLEVGQAIHVGDLPVPEGVVIQNNAELPVFMVHAPRVEAAATDTPAAAAPEVITEKKAEAASGDKEK